MIDVHCHLTDSKYDESEISGIVENARASGVDMLTNGTGTSDSRKAVSLAQKCDRVWVCVGVAYETGTDVRKAQAELEYLCDQPKVVGIGESGLNFYPGISEDLKQYQVELFRMHLNLARKFNLPLQVHNRNADAEIIEILNSEGGELKNKVLLHCFSGSTEFMEIMYNWGCYFSFGGMITYAKNESLRQTLLNVPDDRLLLETDAPYLPPEPLRGTRNEPVNVKIVVERVARIKGLSCDEIEKLTNYNARRLFLKIK